MSLSADQITIAITVYSRRQYIERAVESALSQTLPVRVIVVEDCGPDPGLREFVEKRFGDRISYFRNSRRRGLFDNWNACMEYCQTPWLSILHDDDYLTPVFAESMIALSRKMPVCGLYFGATDIIDENDKLLSERMPVPMKEAARKIELLDGLTLTPFPFPGQLFRVDYCQSLGAFRKTSLYCGDWEMWMKLISSYGAAQTKETVACQLQHSGWDRGTNQVMRAGTLYALSYVQYKRNVKLLLDKGVKMKIDRLGFQKQFPMPARFLLQYGSTFSRRMLKYNTKLLFLSESPHWRHLLFKIFTRIGGNPAVKTTSQLWRLLRRST